MSARRRRWGFHELDSRHARELVRSAGVTAGDLVVDLGAGRGAITQHLLREGARVVAVELHAGRAQRLRERFPDVRVLELDLAVWRPPQRDYRAVANPPFALLTTLLRAMTADRHLVQADLVVPSFVAARWSRGAGLNRDRYTARTVRLLPATAFTPPATQPTAVLRVQRREGWPC